MEVLKVSTKSNPNSVAGALAAVIKEKNVVIEALSNLLFRVYLRKFQYSFIVNFSNFEIRNV